MKKKKNKKKRTKKEDKNVEKQGIDPRASCMLCRERALPFELRPRMAIIVELRLSSFYQTDKNSSRASENGRGCSSNGRARASHARDTGIDTLLLHIFVPIILLEALLKKRPTDP